MIWFLLFISYIAYGGEAYSTLQGAPVNMRNGPGREHKILFTYKKKNIPFKFLHAHHDWIKVQDSEGTVGWIRKQMLGQKSYALVNVDSTSLYKKQSQQSLVLAILKKNVLVQIKKCDLEWCHISLEQGMKGYLQKSVLWGVSHDVCQKIS